MLRGLTSNVVASGVVGHSANDSPASRWASSELNSCSSPSSAGLRVQMAQRIAVLVDGACPFFLPVVRHGQIVCDFDLDLLRRLLPDADAPGEGVIGAGALGRTRAGGAVQDEAFRDVDALARLVAGVGRLGKQGEGVA